MSARFDNSARPRFRLIVGGASATTTCSASNIGAISCDRLGVVSDRSDAALSASALLALVPHAKSRRYWLIDPIPMLSEIAVGAPLTRHRLRQLDLIRDVLDAQVRPDDAVGQALLVGLRKRLQDVEQVVAATAAALDDLGDSAGARLLVDQLEASEPPRAARL